MKSFFRFLMLICFLFGLIVVAFSQDKTIDETAVKELKAIYKEFDEAGKKCDDVKVLEKYLDENYELKTGDARYSRAEIIGRNRQFCSRFEEITESTSEIEKIEVRNDGSYFLEVKILLKGIMRTTGGKRLPFEITGKSTDIWKKNAGTGWKETGQISHGGKLLINGMEFPL